MKKQILILALALATPIGSIVSATIPAFADTPVIQIVQPKAPILQQRLSTSGENVNAPGPGGYFSQKTKRTNTTQT
jgi:hypothetical protein